MGNKRGRLDSLFSWSRLRSIQLLTGLLILYLIFVGFEIPVVLRGGFVTESPELEQSLSLNSHSIVMPNNDNRFLRKEKMKPVAGVKEWKIGELNISGLVFDISAFNNKSNDEFSEIHRISRSAFELGKKVLDDLKSGKMANDSEKMQTEKVQEKCANSVVLSGNFFVKKGNMMEIPCGMSLGSHITVVGRPRPIGSRPNSKESQFAIELRGLKVVDGEEPPKILHFNPRLKGDWSRRPVIELNTCYRMHWGSSQRCEGWKSRADEETVDGKVKCERWIRDDNGSEEIKISWWLKRLIGRTRKVVVDWPFPFTENKLFVLTIIAGLEGFHINVYGRHVSSFPYRPGFTLEDATGLFVDGAVDIDSVVAASLPTLHPVTAPRMHLDLSPEWKAPRNPTSPVDLFIGILSAGNHFAERMAVRKSWMQYNAMKSGNVVARFFVALHIRQEVNVELIKEAEYFGDVVIVPYLDHYDLVVLKTVAICEYGVHQVESKHIMKCDDDTFIRIDAVMVEINKSQSSSRSLYAGNINYYHKPLRHGKWTVSYEEWPEESYPPYANGPGYIISSDIAGYILNEFEKHKLRLFKMEDVSMGMWVEQFNTSWHVDYVHSLKFCQFGCVEGYYTAHYQSPRQMRCLWEKLQLLGKPRCWSPCSSVLAEFFISSKDLLHYDIQISCSVFSKITSASVLLYRITKHLYKSKNHL